MTRMSCIGCAVRHTASISSVAISQTSTKFFTTAAQDSCLKLWELSNNLESHSMLKIIYIYIYMYILVFVCKLEDKINV